MFSIFNSPKRLVLEAKADPKTVIHTFRERIGSDGIVARMQSAFSISGSFVGGVDGQNVKVRYISFIRNSLQPTMVIHVENGSDGGAVILTRYTTFIFVRLLMIVWISGALIGSAAILFSKTAGSVWFAMLFPLGGLLILALMRLFARRDEMKLEEFVHDVIKRSETEQLGGQP